jgi:hypothetical protein
LSLVIAILAIAVAQPTRAADADRDPYGGWTDLKGKRTGFFHTQEIAGRWWLITPDGNAFFSKGVNSVNLAGAGGDDEEKAAKGDAAKADAWAAQTADRLRSWHLNTAGCWSAEKLAAHHIAVALRPHLTGAHGGHLPDVFDPAWSKGVHDRAREQCAPHKNDPWILGYFTDNELAWGHENEAKAMLDHFLEMPAGSPGHEKAQAFVAEHGKGKAADRFRHEVALAYFRTTAQAIRAADPNHLILGCRFAGHPPDEVYRAMKGHADVVSINTYSPKPPVDLLRDVHKATGLPVMVTEWSVKGRDSGPLTSHGSGPVVATQHERAEHYAKYVRELADCNFCVGFHWFRYRDHPGNNQGLVNTQDVPWQPVVDKFTEVNPTLDSRHAR